MKPQEFLAQPHIMQMLEQRFPGIAQRLGGKANGGGGIQPQPMPPQALPAAPGLTPMNAGPSLAPMPMPPQPAPQPPQPEFNWLSGLGTQF